MYSIENGIVTSENGKMFPVDESNVDYQDYLKWVALGNTAIVKNSAATIEDYELSVQQYMDSEAQSFGYDDIKSAVTYAEEPSVPKFQNEGKSFRAWRSLCWAYCYEQLDKVQKQERTTPSVQELVAELPKFILLN